MDSGTHVCCHMLQDENIKQTAKLIYHTALMESGFLLPDPKDFAKGIYSSVRSSLDISPDTKVEEEDDTEEAEADEKATKEADEADEDSSIKDEL